MKLTCGSLGGAPVDWQGRAHFYSLAARAMRRILVDHARSRQRLRRGGGQQRVPLDEERACPSKAEESGTMDLMALDEALKRLAEISSTRPSQVVEYRFFGGMEGPGHRGGVAGVRANGANASGSSPRCGCTANFGTPASTDDGR